MKKAILTLALGLLASSALAQSNNGLYCGPTGFNINLGVTTKAFLCKPGRVQRGFGPITLNATITATSTVSGFSVLTTPDALPGGDGVFFATSGVIAVFNGIASWYRVTAKASAASISIINGNTTPAESGTTSEWYYWNTTCFRSASSGTSTTATSMDDQRIWGIAGTAVTKPNGASTPYAGLIRHAANNVVIPTLRGWIRPLFLKMFGQSTSASSGGGSATPGQALLNNFYTNDTNLMMIGAEFSIVLDSVAADAYNAGCLVRAEGGS
jgi:hypothetical protein